MTYIVDKHKGKGVGVSGYSLPSEGVGASARPGSVQFRGRDGICKGRGDNEERGKQQTEHVDVDGCEGEDEDEDEDEGKVGRKKRDEGETEDGTGGLKSQRHAVKPNAQSGVAGRRR